MMQPLQTPPLLATIIVPKDNEQLTKAIQAAVQYLMDNGYVDKILATYGSKQGALKTAEINPQV